MDNPRGTHLIIDLFDCASDKILDDMKAIEKILDECVKITGVTCLGKLSHHFKPSGVTMIYLLEESHISAHSWPGNRYISIDYYTCGSADPTKVLDYISEQFKPARLKYRVIERGYDETPDNC